MMQSLREEEKKKDLALEEVEEKKMGVSAMDVKEGRMLGFPSYFRLPIA
jgi:hypothetical protein